MLEKFCDKEILIIQLKGEPALWVSSFLLHSDARLVYERKPFLFSPLIIAPKFLSQSH